MAAEADGDRVVVVIPTYDEALNLETTVRAVVTSLPAARILVVDDASPDGTGRIADRLARDDARVQVLHRSGRRGLGAAYLAGFAQLLAETPPPEVIIEMDADGSHPAEVLPALVASLDRVEVGLVIGSRWIPGGRVEDWPWHRRLISRLGNGYARVMLRLPVQDATAGFRAYRREALVAALAGPVDSQGYCFQIDLARRVADAGYPIVETPITFRERRHGRSKMSGRIVLEAMVRVTRWGLQLRLRRRRS